MATSGSAYAISVAIYAAILLIIAVLFSIWRRLGFAAKYYAPKRYVSEEGYISPPKLSDSLFGWIGGVFSLKESNIIASAGVDAALYVKFLRMGWEIFLIATVLCCAIILPINLTSNEVDKLMNVQASPPGPVNPYTYWVPPPPPPVPTGEDAPPTKDEVIEPPEFYNNTGLPPAPPGLEWRKYADDVPPLPPAPPGYVWYYDATNVPSDYYFTDLDKTTLSNIPPRDTKLIAHAIVSWAVTFLVFLQLWRYCKEALRLRMFYLLNAPPGAESHSVLVTDIPAVKYDAAFAQVAMLDNDNLTAAVDGKASRTASAAPSLSECAAASSLTTLATEVDVATGRWEIPNRWAEGVHSVKTEGSVQGMVASEFTKIYQSDYSHNHMAFDTSALDALVADYDKTALAAQDLVDNYISQKSRGIELKPKMMTVIGAKLGAWGREKYGLKPTKVDALEFYQDRLAYLKTEIDTAQIEAKKSVWPSSFVTFNRRTAQVVASGALMCEDLTAWRVEAAPRPEEIVWKNLGLRAWERSSRGALMWISFTLLTLFFLIPVTAIQAILTTNVSVDFIQDIPIVSSIITAILPSLVLTIFIAMLPPIITAMNRWAGMICLSQIDLGLMTRFFIFQIVTVFFGSFIAGSAANQFKQLVNDPGSIVNLLGTAAPQTSIFFMTYITLRGLFTVPFSILRLVPFIIFWVKTKYLASTERAKARLWQNQMFSYGTVVPGDTIVILLGLTFCIICPIIAPVALVYFTAAYIVRKHNLVYVFRQPYQAGAMAWPRIFNQICTGLIIFQLVMICLLALKKSIAAPIICIPLPFLTLVFMRAASSTFWRPMEALSLMAAAELDAKQGAVAPGSATAGSAGGAASTADAAADPTALYLSPSFDVDMTAHTDLLDDCKRMKSVLDGGADADLFNRDVVDAEDFEEEIDAVKAVATEVTTGAAVTDPAVVTAV
ncbi:hypothetical protein Ndes2437B_g07075 [Nannochloris sp. 'desiccata']